MTTSTRLIMTFLPAKLCILTLFCAVSSGFFCLIFCYYTRIPGVCQAKIRVFFTFLSKFCTKKRGLSIRNPNHCGAFLKTRRFLDKVLRQEYNKNGIRKKEVEKLRIIHCADLHLGSKIQAKLPPDKAEIRRKEVRAAFENMLKFAYENRVSAVINGGAKPRKVTRRAQKLGNFIYRQSSCSPF